MIETAVTRDWGLRYPLIQAPMAGIAGGRLAGAVTAAGGLGMLGVGSATSAEWIATEAALARERGRFGIGLMVWALERRPELLELALAARPFAVSPSFGDPAPYVPRLHAAGIRVAAQAQDAASARQAAAAGVDLLVAQGIESGGHTGAVGTLPLLQIVRNIGEAAGLPVLAAGGIGSGRAIAGLLVMGAAGVWIGTRFVATAEAQGSATAKHALVQADETQTVHTRVFDIVQGIPWPPQYPGRALQNNFTQRWHGREPELRERLPEAQRDFQAARERGDLSQSYVYAGQAAGLVDEILPAGELVERLMREAEQTLAASTVLCTAGSRAG